MVRSPCLISTSHLFSVQVTSWTACHLCVFNNPQQISLPSLCTDCGIMCMYTRATLILPCLVFWALDFATRVSFNVGLIRRIVGTAMHRFGCQELVSFLPLTSWIPEVRVAWWVVFAKPLHYLLVVHKPVQRSEKEGVERQVADFL